MKTLHFWIFFVSSSVRQQANTSTSQTSNISRTTKEKSNTVFQHPVKLVISQQQRIMRTLSLLLWTIGTLTLCWSTWWFQDSMACSDILVTPKASVDGSAMIAYNADDPALYGVLYHYPPTQGNNGSMVQVYEWDTGVSLLRFDTFFICHFLSFSVIFIFVYLFIFQTIHPQYNRI